MVIISLGLAFEVALLVDIAKRLNRRPRA